MATFLLVQPAWLGGWCWDKVATRLRAHGHDVHAPTLTGLGERAHLATPVVGLATHIDDIVSVAEFDDLDDMIQVGTSSGGTVITGVANRIPERIASLVYLDAFLPSDGQCTFDLLPPERRGVLEGLIETEGEEGSRLGDEPEPIELGNSRPARRAMGAWHQRHPTRPSRPVERTRLASTSSQDLAGQKVDATDGKVICDCSDEFRVDPQSMSLDIPKEMVISPTQSGGPGMTRPFRFGVVAPLRTDLPTWRDRVRRIADSGYSTLLMPDVPQWQPAPGPTLASAAAVADLRVGTWVYASPLRPAWMTAWEAHSLSVLTDRRFELGIGTGRPGIEDELREKGLPVVPPSERLAQVRETVRALRDLDGPDHHTPVVMAVRGPKAQALAADVADTVTFTSSPGESRVEVARLARDFRAARDLELALHVSVVGDTVAPFMAPPDTDTAAVRAADSLAMLPDDPAAAAEEIQRRREEIGFSYFVFGADFADRFAPVVAELAGR